jgi:hypothetical protein
VRLLLNTTAVLAGIALTGCAATKQQVSDNLGNRFVDTEIAYVWQLSGITTSIPTKEAGQRKQITAK